MNSYFCIRAFIKKTVIQNAAIRTETPSSAVDENLEAYFYSTPARNSLALEMPLDQTLLLLGYGCLM
ncbi:hypothetical protein PanWU01x14_211340 [Parasponia andersonii]|uniref:Uncharacterized protein n=1 Tax=Parasponia andersonii TaxID=3476 RepID=A0A2P5BTT5_PARAD|nr:hypothetical protein PanWU01x14_211340 [Parasponia andersonii]